MVTPSELEAYLHRQIPMSEALGIEVIRAERSGVTLSAPLAPNINHRETVFGGSMVSVAILSCWALVWVRLQSEATGSRIVIHRSEMEYSAPIDGSFRAMALPPPDPLWERFLETSRRKGRSRIHVAGVVEASDGKVAGVFHGHYVALASLD